MIDQTRVAPDPRQHLLITLHLPPGRHLFQHDATAGRYLSNASERLDGDFLIRLRGQPVRVDLRRDVRVCAADGYAAARDGRQQRDTVSDEVVGREGVGGRHNDVDGDVFDFGPVGGEFGELG